MKNILRTTITTILLNSVLLAHNCTETKVTNDAVLTTIIRDNIAYELTKTINICGKIFFTGDEFNEDTLPLMGDSTINLWVHIIARHNSFYYSYDADFPLALGMLDK